jgi:hypothetical protein
MAPNLFRKVKSEPILSELDEMRGDLTYLSTHDIYRAYLKESEQYPAVCEYMSQFKSEEARKSMIVRLMTYNGWKQISRHRWAAPEENQ